MGFGIEVEENLGRVGRLAGFGGAGDRVVLLNAGAVSRDRGASGGETMSE